MILFFKEDYNMKLTFLILSIAIILSIMAGCEDGFGGDKPPPLHVNHVENKDDHTDAYSDSFSSLTKNNGEKKDITNPNEIEKQSLSVKRNIASEKQVRKRKLSSRRGLSAANLTYDKLPSLQSKYQVIAENNLFRPLGWKKEVLKETTPKAETIFVEIRRERPAPTYNLSLTGIAQNGSSWIAIVEDETKKEAYFLNRSEKLKDVLVSEILAEHIILVIGEDKVQFPLGASIQYDANEHIIPNTIINQSVLLSIPKSEIRNPNSGEDTQSLIEQMRARRRKELGQE